MYLAYQNSRDSLFLHSFVTSQHLFDVTDVFSLYKERFVISGERAVPAWADCFFTYFFSYDNFWWREKLTNWDLERKKGVAVFSDTLIAGVLRQRRTFLLHYGQRRVVTRVSSWFISDIWTAWSFTTFGRAESTVSSQFTYRHLAQSDLYSAGVLLGQPNLYFFVYILSNPYFWSVLQQTLNSQYRHR